MKQERQFFLPQNTVLFSDLDNTLVEGGYKFNSEIITSTIARAQRNGWEIGLSSDTPYESLEIWRNKLGMNGPLIAEKGAVVELDGKFVYNKEDSVAFLSAREEIAKALFNMGFLIWEGDPVEALRTDLQIGNSGNNIVLINALRKCSLGIFFRRVGQNGDLVVDTTTMRIALREIKRFYPPFQIDEDFNERYGLVIVARGGINKRSGTKLLMDKRGFTEIGMIGDSMSDYIGSDIAKHYAVANAKKSFQKVAHYVAKNTLTKGVVEILNKLVSN